MRRTRFVVISLATGLLLPAAAHAEILCAWFGRCLYESRGFRITVADADTRQPLADVHALAVWALYGYHGINGPLMVQEAVSGQDGVLAFPAWGPIPGPRSGLVHGSDPQISLFKAGYSAKNIQNRYPRGTEETTRVRIFGQDGETVVLERFRGTPKAWMEELGKAAYPQITGRTYGGEFRPFRSALLNRLYRVRTEAANLPQSDRDIQNFMASLERNIKSTEDDQ